ncbi:nitrite reductase large subunit NirB [Paenibacillus sp. NEAU-GSW1]|uniref:nitrite reductase large subunit NirB n=1 Tax=Paenibacillus sp. NEAU-GSW1 TaxID=2682486 RepID=UPI0012E23090|nr:nitrite reductase large subunit NirB [Paenibacillus sp. NEAU-GSW1]MUT67034.1 NAD(P)/FAD-dependent oxidoreductase [Paenibacillus sp. NEAU-GSW1]
MKKERLVVIGNGMAGVKCVEQIYDLNPDAFDITIIGSEPHPNYNRIQLSKVLQGDTKIDEIIINDWKWYEERGIRLFTGEKVTKADTVNRRVMAESGLKVDYDKLIFATGSSAFKPNLSGVDKEGVTAFRTMADCETMIQASTKYKRAAVIGGGLLGLEAARGLLNLGMEVSVIHNATYLMNRQLDVPAADLLKRELTEQGMQFLLDKRTEKIIGRKRAEGLLFTDGSKLAADLIVLAVGISPNTAAAAASGIKVNRAIVINDYMETSAPNVFAVGECAEHRDIVYGLVAPLYEQGKVLAQRLVGAAAEPYKGSVPYAQLKVSGVDVFSVGMIRDDEAQTAIQTFNGINKTYKKVTMRSGKVAGAVLYGDSSEAMKLLELVKKSASVSALQTAAQDNASSSGFDRCAAMPDDETVCACNAVNKATIVNAVCAGGLKTVDEVRDKTKASGSCGGCKPVVAMLIDYAQKSGGSSPAAEPPICGCTELGHAAVKEAIGQMGIATAKEAMIKLNWSKPEGCGLCRRALRYYTKEHEPAPRTAAVTVGPNGAVRNRGWYMDNTVIGNELIEQLDRLAMPHTVRISVSAGPAYPIGTLVHDFGIAAAPAGWEVYAGGYAENPVKQGKLISIEPTEEAAIGVVLSCLQRYRENANYGERVWKWLERHGLQRLRETVLDLNERDGLLDRLLAERQTERLNPVLVEGMGS